MVTSIIQIVSDDKLEIERIQMQCQQKKVPCRKWIDYAEYVVRNDINIFLLQLEKRSS